MAKICVQYGAGAIMRVDWPISLDGGPNKVMEQAFYLCAPCANDLWKEYKGAVASLSLPSTHSLSHGTIIGNGYLPSKSGYK